MDVPSILDAEAEARSVSESWKICLVRMRKSLGPAEFWFITTLLLYAYGKTSGIFFPPT